MSYGGVADRRAMTMTQLAAAAAATQPRWQRQRRRRRRNIQRRRRACGVSTVRQEQSGGCERRSCVRARDANAVRRRRARSRTSWGAEHEQTHHECSLRSGVVERGVGGFTL